MIVPTYFGIRDYLWAVLPECREHLLQTQNEWLDYDSGDDGGISAYSYLSGAYMHPVMEAASERGDVPVVRRGIAVMEDMLARGDDLLQDPLTIRVLHRLTGTPALIGMLRRFAGPLVRRDMAGMTRDPSWLEPGELVDTLVLPDSGLAPDEVRAARSVLWEAAPMLRTYLLTTEHDLVRETGSLSTMTADRYILDSFAGGLLPWARDYWGYGNPDYADGLLPAAEAMLTSPVLAAALRRCAGAVAAEAELLAAVVPPDDLPDDGERSRVAATAARLLQITR
ncbi:MULTISPECIES: hypothetical protein [Actinoplanes]|uniref:hypothetical protein n=1 Tax=Actinoplanes TaxID=1865 RepID=UPI0005F2AD3E|nr:MULTISPECIES: hypothetical protein [Actinoplanes]GLY02278.1 hypothetical protein Acsp01_26570 [Actinoplanes sp. NBRC 101535]